MPTKKNKKLKPMFKIILGIVILLVLVILIGIVIYNFSLQPVDKNDKNNVSFVVNEGDVSSTIISNLKKEDLIKSELATKIYVKLHNYNLMAGTYTFNKSYSTKEIISDINTGKTNNETITITFIEGKRLESYASTIADNFEYSKEEVLAVMDDKTYLNELINKYDFLTTDILSDGIYHPLEGYLFPDTYSFYLDASIKDIIEKMLDNTASKLGTVNQNGKFTIHQIMTLASIVELEGAGTNDRAGIAGVFINRLNAGIRLGSDVTTYYAVGKDFTSDLRQSELDSCNGYNTRGACVSGLPIGPICSPGLDAINAALNPTENNYFYFVADKNGKVYYNETDAGHNETINKLRADGLWYEY